MSETMKKNFPSLSDGNTSFLRAARAGHLDKVLEHLKQNIDINTSNANGLNALHLASKDGHVEVVAELLRRGANVDAATKKGNTALHIASLAGQEEVVKLLVQHGASVNVQSQNGFTPLYMAAQENHDNVVKYLLANGANQSLATEDGFTPVAVAMQQGHDKVVAVLLENDSRGKVRLPALHIAAKKDDVKAAKLLLDNDHNPDVTSKSAFTPLHIASHYGNEAVANLLIQKGADVNYAAKHNITPLHVAAKWGKANMVSLLVDKGANIESKTRDGLTPLHCAARSGHEQVVEMLLERGAPISSKTKNGLAPLHMAAQGDHVEAARKLLNHRAPVDEVTVDYLTALHVAAHCGHVRVAKLLLDRGADANARALNGFTPLHIACKKNRIKVVELLLKHGACISATTESGLTPLHVASFMGCMNIVIYLLQHDANPDVPTVRGETPLHLAARANQSDIIRILLRNGAQVDARAREQQTPLHIASRLGNVDIVMMLLQHGAKVDTTTKDMYTALHIAAKEGQDEVAAALIDNGASLNATSKKGFTPLHLAAKYGNIKVAKLLLQKEAPVDAQGKNGVTPLHVASHYDHQNVALLLLEKGASPHATAKNGHTPLHIAARKNQMDIANTLLEYGAQPNAESKAGFTPLHLSSQEGHGDMSALLIEHKADVNYPSKNGLMPLHLCAQEDRVPVAEILVKNGAEVDAITRDGYTPLHIAGHYGQANMVRFLLAHGANVKATTSIGYTPLHQAAQQGHTNIVNILLENSADPNAVTMNGQTPLQIAQKLGYITVIDTLKVVTTTTTTVNVEEKYRVVAPEGMHETFMSDSEEEGGEDTMLGDHTYRYLTADEMKSLGDDSLPIDVTRDERIDSNRMVTSGDSNILPPQTIEESFSPIHMQQNYVEYVKKYAPDNVDLGMQKNVGKLHWKNFLVSFLVDARGGAMRGCRHSGVRVIVPPRCAQSPTRITCRYVRPQRTPHPPPLMEGEALASRVLELGPVGAKFLGPVVIEIPHFAALRGKEREIVILRSDNGESWKEHQVDAAEEVLNNVLHDSFEADDLNQMEDTSSGRITRIVTQDFPQYFAVVSRVRQEVHAIGPEGGMVSSTVVPQVQAVFPQGALTKKIKVGLQAQPIDPELTAKLLGHGVAVSPVVTVEPRRRKFHKAITLSMPAPRAHSQGMINQYSGSAPTLRLLCSITGGTSRAQWEDVTGSTPLTFVNDCVSFTTTVSARFWLMDCRNIGDATKMATELYREVIHVPFMAKFVVFAKRIDVLEARLRVFCMTDDKEDKTLEHQEHFTEIAKSRDVEVLEGKSQYIEFAGNLVPITKSGEQLQFSFRAFRENRLPFSVRVKDQHAEAVGRALFMKEPKVPKGEPPQQPICILNIVLPEDIVSETVSLTDTDSLKHSFLKENYDYCRPDPRLADVSNLLGEDWVALANQLGLTTSEINVIKSEYPESVAKQAQSMLRMWISQSGNKAQGNTLENALRRIGREDIIPQCLNVDERLEKVRKDELGRSRKDYFDEDDDDRKARKLDKYSAEEKIVVETSEEEEEDFNKTVTERRQQIEKRLSVDRTIPASSQRVEIVQEISSIKRQSLVEDKILEVEQKAKTVTKAEKTTPPTDGIEAVSTIKTTEERTEIKPTRKVEIQSDRRDSDLLEGVTQILETQKTVTVIRQTEVEPKTPMFSKTPPPSPADFILREQAASIQGWDAERKGPMSPKGAALTEEAMQKETSCGPLTQNATLTPSESELTPLMPKPKPRSAKSQESQLPLTSPLDEVSVENISEVSPVVEHSTLDIGTVQVGVSPSESLADTYSDRKKFWEAISGDTEITISRRKRMSLFEEPAIDRSLLIKKRTSIHDLPPVPKPRQTIQESDLSRQQSDSSGKESEATTETDISRIVEEDSKVMSEYQSRFKDPAEVLQTKLLQKTEMERVDSLDSEAESSSHQQGYENAGYISDSGDVEHYISDSEIEDRVPQIRERQMSIAIPVATTRKTIYERSASLPTEDLYEVSARSSKLRKQYYEEQIKKEMIEEQLTSDIEDEMSPERKALTIKTEEVTEEHDDLIHDSPKMKSHKDASVSVKELAMCFEEKEKVKEKSKIPVSVKTLAKGIEKELGTVIAGQKIGAPSKELKGFVVDKQLKEDHKSGSVDQVEDIKDFEEIVHQPEQFTEHKSFSVESDQSATSERSTRSTSIEEQKSQTSKPCDSMEVHIDKSELEYSEKIMEVDQDATDIEVRSLDSVNNTEASEIPEITVTLSGKQRRISEESDEYEDKKPTEPSVSPVREAESPIKQPEQKIEDVVWEVSVESGPVFEEHTDELREDYPRKESKDEDMSLSVREESDLGSEIHQDHSDSALSDKIKSESHSELEKIILDKLQQEKVDPVEAVRIANALITDIETEIGSREILKKPDPCLISEIETPHMSESLRQLVISKGLDKREVELVESVLARRHRELAKLGRVDTEASSMEITDEDLRFSGTDYDYSGMLEQQISELQRQKSAEDLKTVYDTLEKESHEKPEDVKSEKVYRESIKEERQSADTESVEGGKILAHKSDTQTKVTDSFRTERRTSDKKETIAEEDECISETSIEEVVSHTTKKEATVKQTDKMISGTKTEIQKATGHVEEDMKSEVKCVESEVEIKEGDSLKSEKITEQTEIEISKLSGKSEMEKKSEEKTELRSVESQTKTKHEVDHLQKSESKTDISRTKEVKTLEEGAEFEISQIHEKTHTSTKLITEDHTRAESILTSNKTLTDLSKEDITKLVTSGELPSEKEETIREVTTVHEVIKRTSSSESKSSHDDSTKSPDEQSTCSSGRKGDSDTTKTPEKHQEVVFRKVKQKYDADTSSSSGNLKFDRKSGMDFEAYSSSGESHYHSFELDSAKSRPCSSDVEGLVAAGSSEYESALTSQDVSAPSHITSTDYHTAVSSISSKESMKSLDSESSGNLASLEISEASETLVPSTFEVDEDVLKDDHERLPPMRQSTDFSDSEILSYPGESMEASDDDLLNESKSPETQPRMKRSQEMTFQPEPKALVPDSPQSEMGQEVEEKYGSSLDEGSVLSMSVSSTSSAAALRTVISRADSERLEGSMTISGTSEHLSLEDVDGSLIGSKENLMATTSTCTAPNVSDFTVESVSFHTSNVSEDGVFSASTQVTSVTKDIETNETAKKEVVTAKKRGHRRQDSTSSFVPSQLYTEVTKKLQEDLPEADMTHKESASDEKKDMDESEIFDVDVAEIKRSILQEVAEHKDIMEKRDSQSMLSNASSEKSSFEEGEAEAAFNMVAHVSPAHKVKQICPIMEDEDAEKHELEMREKAQKELEVRRQQMRDQSPSAIPDIKITQHMTASVDDEFTYTADQKQKTEEVQDEPETPASTSSKSSVETDQGREYTLDDSGVTFPEEEKTEQTESKSELATVMEKTTCETDKETESSHSDSFEMVEKPDLIDDFVVIEEVAKEAHEFDTEGKTVKITAKKPTKKVDSEIEEYLKKSAPKATTTKKVTDAKYYPDSSSEELGFDFEESPPQPGQEKPAKGRDYVYEYDKELEANKKWIEQQFQGDHAAMMSAGYGYEMEFERAPLEDIKEEDINDFDPTSSRIGSLGSQKESGGSLGSVKDSFSSTPEYDVLAGRKYFTRSGEHDDVSMSSLQEFENLERAMSLENRRAHQGSQDSSSNGSFSKRYYASRSGQGDDVSVSSLKEFEGLEKACIAAHKIEIKVKEEEAMLTQIDEGQESITSESESCETISGKKVVADSDEEDYDKRMFEIDEIIRQAQTNVERFIDLKEGERTESIGRGDSVEEVAKVPDLELDAPIVRTTPKVQWADTEDVMATSTDSLELKQEKPSHHDSTDSLEQKTAADIMTASTDSIEFQAQKAKELIMSDSIETKEDLDRLVSSDSLELATGTNFANLSDSIDEDGSRVGIYDQSSSSGKDISMAKEECAEYKIRPEHMLGSTDSLDPSSSTATHATYQYETDSVFSGSFTSGGSNTMVSSTDTIEQATNVIDLAAAVRKVWFDDDSEAAARQFTTEYVHDGSKPYVTEVIEPCEDDDEFSHRIHRKVELPPEVRKITFTGADANEQLKRFVEGFGEGETVEETEEVDSDGNVHVKRVVQKRYLIHGEKGVTKRVVNDDKGTKTIYSQEIGEAGEDAATAVQSLLKSIAGDTGDGSWQSSPTTASDVLGATPRRPQDESKQGTSQQKASDQHQLSEEMKELLKEMEKDSKK